MDLEERVLALEESLADQRAQGIAMKFVVLALIRSHPDQADLRLYLQELAAMNFDHMKDLGFDLSYPAQNARSAIERVQQHLSEWLRRLPQPPGTRPPVG